jgi:hypothetical protein
MAGSGPGGHAQRMDAQPYGDLLEDLGFRHRVHPFLGKDRKEIHYNIN